jgi:hypothetical protein
VEGGAWASPLDTIQTCEICNGMTPSFSVVFRSLPWVRINLTKGRRHVPHTRKTWLAQPGLLHQVRACPDWWCLHRGAAFLCSFVVTPDLSVSHSIFASEPSACPLCDELQNDLISRKFVVLRFGVKAATVFLMLYACRGTTYI